MRVKIIHITDHALLRWKQRVSDDPKLNVHKIIDVVRKSKIISKKEIIPFPTPRHKNSIYAVFEDILFVLESVEIDEYNLVTVITNSCPNTRIAKKQKKIKKRFIPESKKKRKKLPARNNRVEWPFTEHHD